MDDSQLLDFLLDDGILQGSTPSEQGSHWLDEVANVDAKKEMNPRGGKWRKKNKRGDVKDTNMQDLLDGLDRLILDDDVKSVKSTTNSGKHREITVFERKLKKLNKSKGKKNKRKQMEDTLIDVSSDKTLDSSKKTKTNKNSFDLAKTIEEVEINLQTEENTTNRKPNRRKGRKKKKNENMDNETNNEVCTNDTPKSSIPSENQQKQTEQIKNKNETPDRYQRRYKHKLKNGMENLNHDPDLLSVEF